MSEQSLHEGKDDIKNKEILLAQWQTCVEMANAVSERRDTMNNIFVTLNLAIIATISFMWDTKTIGLLVTGIFVCIIWLLFIRNFRELNKAKYDVINRMEMYLPQQPFGEEWRSVKKNKKYIEGTKLERIIPVSFGIVYSVILIYLCINSYLRR